MALKESSAEHWEEADFRAIFQQHYARIVDILVRLLGDRAQADDVANDAFWRLYRQPTLQNDGNVGGWLYRTATNLGVDTLRMSGRRRQHEEAASRIARENIQAGPLDDLLREERCRRVRQVLSLLKPAQAQLLILRSAGLSYKEIADVLEVKASSVGTLLNRAEEEFRDHYIALHPDEEEL
jgi:RNA polymerase sigma factor (sigma-70 family)